VGWHEIIRPDDLACQGALARGWEFTLRKEVFWGEEMRDDRVILSTFAVPHVAHESGWGLAPVRHGGEDGGAYAWDAPLRSYETDFAKLRTPAVEVDWAATNRVAELAEATFGDLLTIEVRTAWWWTLGMTWPAVDLRGLEQLMLDMIDNPDDLHRLMAFLRDAHMAKLDALEQSDLLSLNTGGAYVGSGGFGWTHQLPQDDFTGHVRTCDMWGFAESQETVGVSPAMFAEFIFPYQLPLLERFGLNCYGCCEPLDGRWDIIRAVPRLRRVSVSPWADKRRMAEFLGAGYIYSMKPSPTELAMGSFDEARIRQGLRRDLEATRGCHVELIMKDNHTIRNDPRRVVRWTAIAKEEAQRIAG
jgi:hypothetical protein